MLQHVAKVPHINPAPTLWTFDKVLPLVSGLLANSLPIILRGMSRMIRLGCARPLSHARHVSANFAFASSSDAQNPYDGRGFTSAPVMVHIQG